MFEMNEWGQVMVRSQEEWDALMRHKPAGARFARIDAPASETIRLLYSDNGLTVIVAGESSVATLGVDVRACDNAAFALLAYVSCRRRRMFACGRVIAWLFARVMMRACGRPVCASCTLAKTRLCGRVAW